jgi:dynein light chain LC8-type
VLAAVVKSVDMSEDMQSEAIEVANEALEKFSIEKVCVFAYSTALSQC